MAGSLESTMYVLSYCLSLNFKPIFFLFHYDYDDTGHWLTCFDYIIIIIIVDIIWLRANSFSICVQTWQLVAFGGFQL